MTNNCDMIRGRLSAYHDGELSTEERQAIDGHLPGCSVCAGELAATAATSRLVSLSGVSARPGFEDRLLERIRARQTARAAWSRRARVARRMSLLAAAILVVVLAGLSPLLIRDRHSATTTSASDDDPIYVALFGPAEADDLGDFP